jgi:AraC family transcriptional regulator, ethanolamine operon transcriptional activator
VLQSRPTRGPGAVYLVEFSLAVALAGQLKTLLDREGGEISETVLAAIEDQVVDVVLGMAPSTEVAEPLHRRARVAFRLRDMMIGSLETPVSVSTMCEAFGVKERTLYLTCVEALDARPKRCCRSELTRTAQRAARSCQRELQEK